MASSLPRRIAVAAVAIPTSFALVYLGGWWLVGTVVVLGLLGTAELYRLAGAQGIAPLRLVGYGGTVLAPVAVFFGVHGTVRPVWLVYAAALWVILTMALAVTGRPPERRPLAAVAVTVFATIYTALLPASILVLRAGGRTALQGTALVFLAFAVTWACDSAAMTGGAMIGGPKFAPTVSPNKTWAGTISGTVIAAVAAPLYGWLFLRPVGIHIPLGTLIFLGVILSIVGQIGDLAESLLKREVGVKDSGSFFPGHGGVLDRLDSLYWVLPVTALLLTAWGVV